MRMFVLKYTDAAKFRRLFSRYSYPMSSNRDYNVLTVTGPASFQAQVEAAMKLFDVAPDPPKNVELAIYLITTQETRGIAARAEGTRGEVQILVARPSISRARMCM